MTDAIQIVLHKLFFFFLNLQKTFVKNFLNATLQSITKYFRPLINSTLLNYNNNNEFLVHT